MRRSTRRPILSVRNGAVDSGLFHRTQWGGIVTSPLFGPALVQLVFVDPDANLRRTLRRVAWCSYYSWALIGPVFWAAFLFVPLPGGVWPQLVLASAAATVGYLMARLLGRLRSAGRWRTVRCQLTKRRSFPGAASEVTLVIPAGVSEFASAVDRATGNYSAGFLREAGWDQVRRYIWSYLELHTQFQDLVGLGFAALEIQRICDADLDQTSVYAAPDRGNPTSPH